MPCCSLCCLPASQAVLKRFRRVSAILVFLLIFRPKWRPNGRKKFFWDQPPLPLSQGLDDSDPTQAIERLVVVLASHFASRIAKSGSRDSNFVKGWKGHFGPTYRNDQTGRRGPPFKAGPEHSGRTKPKWLVPFDVPAEISLAQALRRSFSRWASLACRLFFLFLCLPRSLSLYSKFVDMTINLRLIL